MSSHAGPRYSRVPATSWRRGAAGSSSRSLWSKGRFSASARAPLPSRRTVCRRVAPMYRSPSGAGAADPAIPASRAGTVHQHDHARHSPHLARRISTKPVAPTSRHWRSGSGKVPRECGGRCWWSWRSRRSAKVTSRLCENSYRRRGAAAATRGDSSTWPPQRRCRPGWPGATGRRKRRLHEAPRHSSSGSRTRSSTRTA